MENSIEPYNDNTERRFDQEEAYIRAKKKVKKIVGFYWHLFWYIVVNAFIVYMIAINIEAEDFWSFKVFSTPIFWGIGLFFHFMGVFGPNFLFTKSWEERKINEYLEKEEKHSKWK